MAAASMHQHGSVGKARQHCTTPSTMLHNTLKRHASSCHAARSPEAVGRTGHHGWLVALLVVVPGQQPGAAVASFLSTFRHVGASGVGSRTACAGCATHTTSRAALVEETAQQGVTGSTTEQEPQSYSIHGVLIGGGLCANKMQMTMLGVNASISTISCFAPSAPRMCRQLAAVIQACQE